MGLCIELTKDGEDVYHASITHNLGKMARTAGFYEPLWHPEEHGVVVAGDLIDPLERGLYEMVDNPVDYQKLDSDNGWGKYKNFLPWLAFLLRACKDCPDAKIHSDI